MKKIHKQTKLCRHDTIAWRQIKQEGKTIRIAECRRCQKEVQRQHIR